MIETQTAAPEPDAPPRRARIPRRILLAGIVAVVVIVAAATGFFVWLPHYRPTLQTGERYGIDVSHYQGSIDWPAVASSGMTFAYIKATEGTDFVDPRFTENWAGAAAAGIERGAYHFFTLCSPGTDQASNFLQVVPLASDALPPALDLELSGNCSARPPASTVEQEIGAFLQQVESATGEQVVIYVREDFEKRYPVREWFSRPQWRSGSLRRPSKSDWVIWQLGSFAHVDGIRGHVDLDIMRSPVTPSPS